MTKHKTKVTLLCFYAFGMSFVTEARGYRKVYHDGNPQVNPKLPSQTPKCQNLRTPGNGHRKPAKGAKSSKPPDPDHQRRKYQTQNGEIPESTLSTSVGINPNDKEKIKKERNPRCRRSNRKPSGETSRKGQCGRRTTKSSKEPKFPGERRETLRSQPNTCQQGQQKRPRTNNEKPMQGWQT